MCKIIGGSGGKDLKMATRITTYLTSLAMLLAASLWISPSIYAANDTPQDSSQVAQLFSQARSHAVELRLDAEVMETFTRKTTNWRTQADQIYQIRQHTNDLAQVIQKLNEARDTASPWQQQAIDRLNPMLKDLVASVTSMIHCVDDQVFSNIGAGVYRECVVNNYKVSVQMAGLITDFVDYGRNKERFLEQGRSLDLSAHR
jgi:uncharacterized protein (DUF4415 family)